MDNCLICKKHYSQGGKCSCNKKNCLLFDEEPRGKMIRGDFLINILQSSCAETPILKYDSKIVIDDDGRSIEMTVIKINWINLQTGMCNISADYHESEMQKCEIKKKIFKIVK